MADYTWEIEYHDLPAAPMPRQTVFHKTQSATRKFYEQSDQWLVENNTVTYLGGDDYGTGFADSLPAMKQYLKDNFCVGVHKIPKSISITDPDGITWVKEYPLPKVLKEAGIRSDGTDVRDDVILDETWLEQMFPKGYEEPNIDVGAWVKTVAWIIFGVFMLGLFFG
jgi:hypothetical protein